MATFERGSLASLGPFLSIIHNSLQFVKIFRAFFILDISSGLDSSNYLTRYKLLDNKNDSIHFDSIETTRLQWNYSTTMRALDSIRVYAREKNFDSTTLSPRMLCEWLSSSTTSRTGHTPGYYILWYDISWCGGVV